MVKKAGALCAIIASLAFAPVAEAAEVDEFTKATQNPLARVISMPFQNNTNFDIGPFERRQNVLDIQPVIPFQLGPVAFASRTIIPIMWQPDVAAATGTTSGLGDINATLFISPSTAGEVIWGIGPMISIPVASEENVAKEMGCGKWALGPSAVFLAQPRRWTLGVLIENGWSVAGDDKYEDVDAGLAQPFIIYNVGRGWNVTTAPKILADWKRDGADRWLVPMGGGGGKLLHLGKLPINTSVQGYYYVVHPEVREDPLLNVPYPKWTLRASATFFLPGI